MKIEWKVGTMLEESRIVQSVEMLQDGARVAMQQYLAETRDEGIRRALIALGWTPPGECPP